MEAASSIGTDDKKSGSNRNTIVNVEFTVRTALHEQYVEEDFVHSIKGRILTGAEGRAEEEIGRLDATVVQFAEALDRGISPDRLGDGIDGGISEYWERLFAPEEGRLKEEIVDEYEALNSDLLIIDCVEVCPKFRGRGVGRFAIERTIEIFGTGCGLVACKPWPLQFTPAAAGNPQLLKRLDAPEVAREEAVSKLRKYWSTLGFWPVRDTGIYIRSLSLNSPGGAILK
jgi:GNAT superfamily N-acetyltransferase